MSTNKRNEVDAYQIIQLRTRLSLLIEISMIICAHMYAIIRQIASASNILLNILLIFHPPEKNIFNKVYPDYLCNCGVCLPMHLGVNNQNMRIIRKANNTMGALGCFAAATFFRFPITPIIRQSP
jgi:hypothetical protein